MSVLVAAWHAIRRNAETSQRDTTKLAARNFGENLPRNLRRIQDRLRQGYVFAKAHGATPSKGKGKSGKRPIVVAPLEDRIVQRAILDVLQDASEIEAVQRVLSTPTSIGGIRGRGVDHAIAIFQKCADAGDHYVAGSDISGFFQRISRPSVVNFLRISGVEADFLRLFENALTVELSNEGRLSKEDRKLFPTGDDGVAQGCPLSALAGNIVLRDFDERMNQGPITCIRYIDDFVIVGKSKREVEERMGEARTILSTLKMSIYDPIKAPTKAFQGDIGDPHPFLGYKLIPGSYPPSDSACEKLLERVASLIKLGQLSIRKAVTDRPLSNQDRCYAQTLVAIDNTVRGWKGSFKSSQCSKEMQRLDDLIDRRLLDFRNFYLSKTAKQTSSRQRRALRVSLLAD
jgi:retron-type reverse transcriptase